MSGSLTSFASSRTPRLIALSSAMALSVIQPVTLANAETSPARQTKSQSVRPTEQTKSPIILIASIKKQRIRMYDRSGERGHARISSGKPGFETPTGVFAIIQKNKNHVSNIYGAAMPYMQRLTWSGIALHAGPLPGYRASHGCVRMPHSFAKRLFSTTPMGTRVIVTHEETRPISFSHPNLIRPLPAIAPEGNEIAQAETQVASASPTDGFDTKATLRNLVNLPRYFWFTPALAEAVANLPPEAQPPRSRVEADQFVQDQIARLQQDVDATRTARSKAEKAEAAARKQIRSLTTQLKNNGKVHKNLLAEGDKLVSRLKAAERRHAAFMKALGPALDRKGASFAELEQQEADLEDQILELSHLIEANEKALPPVAKTMDQLTDELIKLRDTAASERRQALQAKSDITFALTALTAAKKEAYRRKKPVSIFVSLRNKRVYVRQGFEPVIDAPIEMIGTPRRFGTHVFTAMGYDDTDDSKFEWQLVTAQAPALRKQSSKKRPKRMRLTRDMQREFAAAALESYAIPEEITSLVRELARPGASLIVSDLSLPSHENGKGVDFVVLTK